MSHCRAASPSPTASNRGVSWPQPCSPSSSASCWACQTASTSVSDGFGVSSQKPTVFLRSASMAPTSTQRNIARTWTSSRMMPVSKEIYNRLSKACSSFGRLSKREWQSYSIRLSTKIQVYRAVVVPTLLYGAETWVLYRKQIRLLERFHRLRSILGIKWQDYVLNEEVLKRATLPSIESILLQVQLHWASHVARMGDTHMPKAVFFSELRAGKRDRGAPRKFSKD